MEVVWAGGDVEECMKPCVDGSLRIHLSHACS